MEEAVCKKCGKTIPNGEWFYTKLEDDEIVEPTYELCRECAEKNGLKVNSIV